MNRLIELIKVSLDTAIIPLARNPARAFRSNHSASSEIPSEFQHVEVKFAEPGLSARVRQGY
jgi:hypothetical protein